MADTTLVELRADSAAREEDYRIARKHRDEAGARPWTPENKRAYEGASDWAETCFYRFSEARGRMIRAEFEARPRGGDVPAQKSSPKDALRKIEGDLTARMSASGYNAGRAAGSWVIDGNTTDEYARAVLKACEDCEFEVPSPLSGEWADGWTIERAFEDAELGAFVGSDSETDLLDAWTDAYHEGYVYEAETSALYQVEDGPGVCWNG